MILKREIRPAPPREIAHDARYTAASTIKTPAKAAAAAETAQTQQ